MMPSKYKYFYVYKQIGLVIHYQILNIVRRSIIITSTCHLFEMFMLIYSTVNFKYISDDNQGNTRHLFHVIILASSSRFYLPVIVFRIQ